MFVFVVVLMLALFCPVDAGDAQRYRTIGTMTKSVTVKNLDACSQKLVFEVKACKHAGVMIKTKRAKEAVFFIIENEGKPESVLTTRSARGGMKTSTYKKGLLNCKSYKTFWINWAMPGVVSAGIGSHVGQNEILRTLHQIKDPLVAVSLFTGMRKKGEWKLSKDEPPVFLTPWPGDVTQIDVPEDTALGTIIFSVEAKDPDDNVTYDVVGVNKATFGMNGSGLALIKELDYETERLHGVLIRAMGGKLDTNASVLVSVTNVLDEPPLIQLSPTQTIPEELPLGETVPGLYTVTQKDMGRGLKYHLEGVHSKYFAINTLSGELMMTDRLDYENSSSPRVLDSLTLQVEDDAGHKARANLSLRLVNLDDNAPRFDEIVYKVKLQEPHDTGKPLARIRCEDRDLEDNANLTVIMKPTEFSDKLVIRRTDTAFELDIKDKEKGIDQLGEGFTVTLEATDSDTSRSNTATALVEIEVSSVNDNTPQWVWPAAGTSAPGVPELKIPETYPPFTTITTFNATLGVGSNPGDIVYTIESVMSDMRKAAYGKFTIDQRQGYLKAITILDYDKPTGGVNFYIISVKATNRKAPNRYSVRKIKLFLTDADDNAPVFSEGFYRINTGCSKKAEEQLLLTFNVTDYDVTSFLTLTMTPNTSNYTRLDTSRRALILKRVLNGTADRQVTFEVMKVTACDLRNPHLNTSVYVMVYYTDCSTSSRRRRMRKKGVMRIPKPPRSCEVNEYVKDQTVEDYIFKATSGILGLILVCIAAFYLSKRTVFKSSPSVNPLEEVQDEPEEETKEKKEYEEEDRPSVIFVGPKRDEKPRSKQAPDMTFINQ
ncbi:protocadherin Fat 1-like [Haliotis rufescens]|uniref:protocadherin Fat 1-like n=1 Tax=Haliotis rufescens TaxID=6454 RepID=UPI00201F199C|nr:protocadherin Fat 1-like [Haliotis rufescens]